MKKLGIILDSFSGMKKEEYESQGIEYINQIVIIDGEVYKEGIDAVFGDLQDKIYKASDLKTSMPAIGLLVEKFEECSKKYENVIFLPMNKGLSSTFSTAFAASNDFENIHVVNNKFIGHAPIYYAKKAMQMSEEGKTIDEIIKFIEKASNGSESYIIPFSLNMIIKSGRLKGMKKFILEKGKLIPRLHLTDDGMETKGVKRTFKKAVSSTIEKILESIGGIENKDKYIWDIAHTFGEEQNKLVKGMFEELSITPKFVPCSAATGAYNDRGSVGITAYKK